MQIDDQICLLINSWCELLLFSCCFRSMSTPGEIRISLGKSITLAQARDMGMQACIERMLNFTEQLRRLRVDKYEYVAMKVIVLLTSGNCRRKCVCRLAQISIYEFYENRKLAQSVDLNGSKCTISFATSDNTLAHNLILCSWAAVFSQTLERFL